MKLTSLILSVVLPVCTLSANSQSAVPDPVRHWSFDQVSQQSLLEVVTGKNDTLEGKFTPVAGVSGNAIRLDGFTAVVRHQSERMLAGADAVTVEAWIALAAYPWNWCPVVTHFKEETGGFSLEIGPRGEVGFKTIVSHNTASLITDQVIERNVWNHVAAVFEPGKGMTVYINGKEAGHYATARKPQLTVNRELRIGMNYEAVYPSDRLGETGITPYWFSLDGIVDEIKVYNKPLSAKDLESQFTAKLPLSNPDLPVRHLPRVESTGKFKAYYTKLEYYPEWDEQWPVGADADVVVTFKDSPVKLIFWRGARYSPAWVTDNHLWMADQSVETWNDAEGCLEHMQDRHCKYSHVRIIEDHPARKVIHWRYAPVSAYNDLWLMNEKTGWEVWIDEYYYVYPDATAIRKYTWKTEYMGRPRQFQESLPFTEENQLQGDVIEADYLRVANMDGDIQLFEYIADPAATRDKRIPVNPNIQQHNFKSKFDPFIIFEPGNKMNYISDRNIQNLSSPGACNHWPVGQAYCDGRRVYAADRPTHFLGFPISDPVIHDGEDGRSWINSLYGMKDLPVEELVVMARSWARAPELSLVRSPRFVSLGYDMSEKRYRIALKGSEPTERLTFKIAASEASPLFNPAFCIENWGEGKVRVMMNGRLLQNGKDYHVGTEERLDKTNMVLWIRHIGNSPVELLIMNQ